jgi:hypothetical protein
MEPAGSHYLIAVRGGDGEHLDGERNYRIALPPDIPQSRVWSAMVYDRQTRSMLQTDQPRPDIGSQSGTVETNPDGSTESTSGPQRPTARPTTGSRPCQGRAGSSSFGCTPPRPASSTRPGSPRRSNRSEAQAAATADAPTAGCIRRALNVESGLNDGIATPFVTFFLAGAVANTVSNSSVSLGASLGDLATGVLVGVGVGLAAGLRLTWSASHGWSAPSYRGIAALATALAAYVVAIARR